MTPHAELATDVAAVRYAHLLAALLDHESPLWRPGELPPLGHFLMFPPDAHQSRLGPDGHPARDESGLPRRMWAGSRIRFLAPIPLGSTVVRETTVLSQMEKSGRSGRMLFVTMQHRLSVDGVPRIVDEQDIVYREPGRNGAPPSPGELATVPPVTRHITADPVQLFRFSALTFNAHRIHYDLPYTVDVEGYPGLVVHGPYLATLLMDLFLRHHPDAWIDGFTFRALRPVFAGEPFVLGLTADAAGGDLIVIDHAGAAAMKARVDIRRGTRT